MSKWIKRGIIGLGALLLLPVGCGLVGKFSPAPKGRVATVTTNFHWLTPNDTTVVDFFDDPDVPGVACYISRPISGGWWSLIGWTEDPSDVSVTCALRKNDPIDRAKLVATPGKRVYSVSTSIAFKQLQVRREFHEERDVILYLSYADALLTGSPKSSTSAVSISGIPR